MQVKILSEHGYEEALFGLGLSHGVTSGDDFSLFTIKPIVTNMETGENINIVSTLERMEGVAQKLAGKGNGHDKFLRQICVWIDITAPRYWWPEMDQYKVATVTQSESTMHTIHKREITREDFELDDFINTDGSIEQLNEIRNNYIETKDKKWWRALIQILPQSYLQRRILTCNYATLRNIIAQRTGHRLSEWAVFIDAVKSQVKHPELLS